MKTLITVLCILVCSTFLFAQAQIKYEWMMNRNFSGVECNKHIALCYGDMGIIVYTTDKGRTWGRACITGGKPILKIISYKEMFFAADNDGIYKSSDGIEWTKAYKPLNGAIYNITILEDSLFAILDSQIVKFNIYEPNLYPLLIHDLPQTKVTTVQMENDGKNIFIKYNYDSLLYVVNLLKDTIFAMEITKDINIKAIGNKLYYFLDKSSDLYYSEDDNLKRRLATNKFWGAAFHIFDNKIHYINSSNQNIYPIYRKVVDTANVERINPTDTSIRTAISYDEKFLDIKAIDDSFIIAVGTYSMIAASSNGGKNWETVSFINHSQNFFSNLSNPISIQGDSSFYVFDVSAFIINKTTNYGITWLPQRINDKVKLNYINIADWGSDGKGILFGTSSKLSDSNSIITYDYGENYSYYKKFDWIDKGWFSSKPFKSGKFYIFPYIIPGNYNIYTAILRLDEKYQFVDSAKLNLNIVAPLIKSENGDIYLFGYYSSGASVNDNKPDFPDYTYKYYLLRSIDDGATWDTLNTPPLYPTINFHGRYFITDRTKDFYKYQKDYLIINNDNNIYYYNINTGTYDSLNIKIKTLSIPITIGSAFYLIADSNIYFKKNYFDKSEKFDSVKTTDYINLEHYDILGYYKLKNKTIIALSNPRLNFLTVYDDSFLPVEDPITIHKYLWASPPYPNPVKGIVNSQIYWGNDLKRQNMNIKVYDYLGNHVDGKVEFAPLSEVHGIISLDCWNLQRGVYTIIAGFPEKQIPIRIVVE